MLTFPCDGTLTCSLCMENVIFTTTSINCLDIRTDPTGHDGYHVAPIKQLFWWNFVL